MADITTPEGREELRRRMQSGASFVLSPDTQHAALDGLDIAQKAMRVIRANEYGCRYVEGWDWEMAIYDAGAEALAEWDTWQGK